MANILKTFRLTRDNLRFLERQAKAEGTTPSELLRSILSSAELMSSKMDGRVLIELLEETNKQNTSLRLALDKSLQAGMRCQGLLQLSACLLAHGIAREHGKENALGDFDHYCSLAIKRIEAAARADDSEKINEMIDRLPQDAFDGLELPQGIS